MTVRNWYARQVGTGMNLLAATALPETVASMAGFRYDDSPHRLDEFVSIDEVNEIIADQARHLAKDHRRTEHFVQRVHNTLTAIRAQIQKLHRDVQAAQIRSTTVGAPTTLDPRSAARFLPPEELAALADELIKEKFAALKASEEDLAATRAEMVKRIQLLKFTLAAIEEDNTVPYEVRVRLTETVRLPLEDLDAHLAPYVAAPAASPPPPPEGPTTDTSGLDELFA